MSLDRDTAIAQLPAVGRYMIEHELTWGNAGNVSARIGVDRYVITASGTRLGELAADDLVECGLEQATAPAHGRKPSKERPMHEAIYMARPEINAVLHASPFYSTMIACSDVMIPSAWFVESMYYLERVARVTYCHPGSADLAAAVLEQAANANVLLLDNHGVLVYDISVHEALNALHTLEMTCRMWLQAKSAGITLRELPQPIVEDFLVSAAYKPRREWRS